MKVSIIIPNYNGEKFLEVCLDSLMKQTFKFFEIIIIDNGSKDNSCNLIQEKYSNIKLIRLSQNYGFSRAVNEGIRIAEGEYIVLLNNDTEVHEEWLNNLIKCIEKNGKTFSCSSKMIRYNERDKIDDAGDEYSILGWAYKRGDGAELVEFSKEEEIFSSCAGAAIYRKSLFDKIGYFDEKFFAYMEDVDISYRARVFGYKNVYCPNAIVYHIGSATSGSKYNSFKVKLAARNNIYVIIKNMPIIQLLINSPFLILGFLVKLIFFSFNGYGKEYICGFFDAFRTIKEIDKVKFSKNNLLNYVKIEWDLLKNIIRYVLHKFKY
jgi:GT2 family glycosyltransferase